MNKAFSIVTLVAGLSVFGFACSLSGKHDATPVREGVTVREAFPQGVPDAGVAVIPEPEFTPAPVHRAPVAKKVARKPVVQLEGKATFCRSIDLANGRIGEKVLACEYITG